MKLRWSAALLAALLVGACEMLPTDTDEDDDAAQVGEVGAAGGSVATSDGGVKLDFPAGAVSGTTPITVEPAPNPPQNPDLIPGTAYEFGPDGTTFSTPVKLTIRYDKSKLPQGTAESSLGLYKLIGGSWQKITGSGANPAAGTVSGSISSFSTYGILSGGSPKSLSIHAGDAQSATVGQSVATPPAVLVRNERGEPLSGVVVAFSVADSAGTVSGDTVTTDTAGIAAVGAWTVGTRVGEYRLMATAVGAADVSVTFTATALAGPATGLALHAGRGQSAPLGRAVATPPAVKVADAHGNPLAGATVTFSLTADQGSITGAKALTDSAGIAAVGSWTLGMTPGAKTLAAALEGVSEPLTITAAAVEPCAWMETYTIGSNAVGELDALDCAFGADRRIDHYRLTTDKQVSLTISMTSEEFTPIIRVLSTDELVLVSQFGDSPGFTRALLAPGSYIIAVHSLEHGVTGAYQLNASTATHDVDQCAGAANVFATPGTTTKGSLTAGNCPDEVGDPTWRWDRYIVMLEAGKSYTATMRANGPATLSRWGPANLEDLQGTSDGKTPMVVTYTPEATGYQSFYALGPVGTSYDLEFTALSEPIAACDIVLPYTVGATVKGWLNAGGCADGLARMVDSYYFETDKQVSVLLTMHAEYAPFVGMYDGANVFVVTQYTTSPGFTRAILAPGKYRITARSVEPGATGYYEMSAILADHDVDECGLQAERFITAGVTATGTLTAGNCIDEVGPDPTMRWDAFNIWLLEGQTYTFTMSMDRGALLSLWQGANHITARDRPDAGEVSLDHTATVTGWHTLNPVGPVGTAYRITVTDPGGATASLTPGAVPLLQTTVVQPLGPKAPLPRPMPR